MSARMLCQSEKELLPKVVGLQSKERISFKIVPKIEQKYGWRGPMEQGK